MKVIERDGRFALGQRVRLTRDIDRFTAGDMGAIVSLERYGSGLEITLRIGQYDFPLDEQRFASACEIEGQENVSPLRTTPAAPETTPKDLQDAITRLTGIQGFRLEG